MSHFFKAILPRLFTLMRFCARLWERVGRKIKLTRKIFLPAAIACMALAGMESAYAATAQCSTAFNPTRVDFNQVNIPPNAQVGDVLASVTVDFPVNCPANPNASGPSGFYLTYLANSAYKPSSTVWGAWELPSPTVGMGIRVTNITHNMVLRGPSCNGTAIVLDMNCFFAPEGLTTIPTAFSLPIKFRVELVKTATNTATGAPATTIMAFRNYDVVSKTMSNSYGNLWFGAMTPQVSTCTVTTPKISVRLPILKVSDLSSPGTPAGRENFQIDLSCNGGKTVYVTLTDATDPSNRSNLLTLSKDSSAGNVKLQILKRSDYTPVNFGPDSAVLNNPGQWLFGSSGAPGTTGNNRSILLAAQYVSTGPVTPGTVNAVATFTLYYQ